MNNALMATDDCMPAHLNGAGPGDYELPKLTATP